MTGKEYYTFTQNVFFLTVLVTLLTCSFLILLQKVQRIKQYKAACILNLRKKNKGLWLKAKIVFSITHAHLIGSELCS